MYCIAANFLMVDAMPIWKKFSYVWVTSIFFLFSLLGYWFFGWLVYNDQQVMHYAPIEFKDFAEQAAGNMFANWQSDFLQLLFLLGWLSILFSAAMRSFKKQEEKIDLIMKRMERVIEKADQKFQRK